MVAVPFAACGPDAKPPAPCDGPTFDLRVQAEDGPVPLGTEINVRYGGNHDGETYTVGESHMSQAVFCQELAMIGGAPSVEPSAAMAGAAPGGATGAGGSGAVDSGVMQVKCRLYTQGAARLDVDAEGYEPIEDQELPLTEDERCQVPVKVVLQRMLDAGK